MENTLHANYSRIQRYSINATLLLIGAWSGTTYAVEADAVDSEAASSYSNFLVIGISGDYDTRAQFERMTVAELRRKGAAASTYYSMIGGNNPVAKEDVIAAIQARGFDAVLVMRALDAAVDLEVKKSRTEIDARTIGDRFVNLFRSTYTDYKTPGSLDLSTSVTFAIELYSVASEDIVWSIDHSSKKETDLGLLIDKTAATIAKQLDREDLIAN